MVVVEEEEAAAGEAGGGGGRLRRSVYTWADPSGRGADDCGGAGANAPRVLPLHGPVLVGHDRLQVPHRRRTQPLLRHDCPPPPSVRGAHRPPALGETLPPDFIRAMPPGRALLEQGGGRVRCAAPPPPPPLDAALISVPCLHRSVARRRMDERAGRGWQPHSRGGPHVVPGLPRWRCRCVPLTRVGACALPCGPVLAPPHKRWVPAALVPSAPASPHLTFSARFLATEFGFFCSRRRLRPQRRLALHRQRVLPKLVGSEPTANGHAVSAIARFPTAVGRQRPVLCTCGCAPDGPTFAAAPCAPQPSSAPSLPPQTLTFGVFGVTASI